MWTTRYRVVPPIGVVSAPLPPEIDRLRLISIIDGRFRAISAEGEKKPEVWLFARTIRRSRAISSPRIGRRNEATSPLFLF
ncbi:hypothetical protein B296_00049897, partial [Ensete ventricosum]